jgi:ppGpp synthetase/RelA/SpoT-type nucleotidyltranferase
VDVISTFIARYVKEYDFYDQAARLVKERLEISLRTSGVRCMVTSRAKDVSRLEEKCRQRDRSRHYSSADQIFDDIADLAGVRVALYFPAERHHVDSAINNLFRLRNWSGSLNCG